MLLACQLPLIGMVEAGDLLAAVVWSQTPQEDVAVGAAGVLYANLDTTSWGPDNGLLGPSEIRRIL